MIQSVTGFTITMEERAYLDSKMIELVEAAFGRSSLARCIDSLHIQVVEIVRLRDPTVHATDGIAQLMTSDSIVSGRVNNIK
jgi:hypothetical protein